VAASFLKVTFPFPIDHTVAQATRRSQEA
jgi:hypothetical protein